MQKKGLAKGIIIGIILGVIVLGVIGYFIFKAEGTSFGSKRQEAEVIDIYNLSDSQIREIILNNSQPESYNIDLDYRTKLKLEFFGKKVEADMKFDVEGSIDNANKEGILSGNIRIVGLSEEGEKIREGTYEVEIKDGYVYSNINGETNKTKLTDDLWKQFDTLPISLDYLNNYSFEVIGEEEIEGVDCYILEMHVKSEDVLNTNTKAMSTEQLKQMEEAIKGKEFKIWVDKTNLQIKKGVIYLDFDTEAFGLLLDIRYVISDFHKAESSITYNEVSNTENKETVIEIKNTGDCGHLLESCCGIDETNEDGTITTSLSCGSKLFCTTKDDEEFYCSDEETEQCGDLGQACCFKYSEITKTKEGKVTRKRRKSCLYSFKQKDGLELDCAGIPICYDWDKYMPQYSSFHECEMAEGKCVEKIPYLSYNERKTCETDSDCVYSEYNEMSCCPSGQAVNLAGKEYIEKWREQNCEGFDVSKRCTTYLSGEDNSVGCYLMTAGTSSGQKICDLSRYH